MENIIKERQQIDDQRPKPDYMYYDSKYVPEPFGLNNIGAICWCNSLLQMMLGLPSLNKVLLDSENELSGNPFAMEYIKVLKATLPNDINIAIDTSKLTIASAAVLGGFLTKLRQNGLTIQMGAGQECVDEAFTLFIDMFGCPKIENLFSNVYELIVECKHCKKKVSSIRDKSYRLQLFTNVKLEDQNKFCGFLKVHPSECDFYKCEECGNCMSKFFRAERLRMLREVVVIIFNKFQMKDNRWFPQKLVFGAKKKHPDDAPPPLTYKLVGKIEHSGTTSGGHYWAQSLRGNNWYRLNDNSVMYGDHTPTHNTFMVAYHLVDPEENK